MLLLELLSLKYFPMCQTTNGPFTVSVYAPVCFDFMFNMGPKTPSFLFQNAWVIDQQSHHIVRKSWAQHIRSSRFFRIQHKLAHIIIELKEWDKKTYGHPQNKLLENSEKIITLKSDYYYNLSILI